MFLLYWSVRGPLAGTRSAAWRAIGRDKQVAPQNKGPTRESALGSGPRTLQFAARHPVHPCIRAVVLARRYVFAAQTDVDPKVQPWTTIATFMPAVEILRCVDFVVVLHPSPRSFHAMDTIARAVWTGVGPLRGASLSAIADTSNVRRSISHLCQDGFATGRHAIRNRSWKVAVQAVLSGDGKNA